MTLSVAKHAQSEWSHSLAIASRSQRVKANSESLPAALFLMTNSFETGGTERQFVTLAQALNPSRFRVHLGCIQSAGKFQETIGDVSEFGLGGSLYGTQSIKTRVRLFRHLRNHGVAVAHAFDFYSNLTLIPAAWMARVPVKIGSHRQIGDLLTPAQFRAQATAFLCCDKVVCNSQAAAARLLKAGIGESKVAVIGNGLPRSAFAATEPALRRVAGVLRVGMLARMNASYKNHHVFLRIAAQLRTRFPQVEFLLIGDGPLRPELQRQAEAFRIGNCVSFLGERNDIPAVLASLDVSVVPSASESLSNVILESMAAGLPVVASAVGGNPELLHAERGILFPVDNDDAFRCSIERLLADAELRTRISEKARKFALANFRIEDIAKAYEHLYADLLARRKWRPN